MADCQKSPAHRPAHGRLGDQAFCRLCARLVPWLNRSAVQTGWQGRVLLGVGFVGLVLLVFSAACTLAGQRRHRTAARAGLETPNWHAGKTGTRASDQRAVPAVAQRECLPTHGHVSDNSGQGDPFDPVPCGGLAPPRLLAEAGGLEIRFRDVTGAHQEGPGSAGIAGPGPVRPVWQARPPGPLADPIGPRPGAVAGAIDPMPEAVHLTGAQTELPAQDPGTDQTAAGSGAGTTAVRSLWHTLTGDRGTPETAPGRPPGTTVQIPLAGSGPEGVQVETRDGRVSLVIRDAPLSEVLGALAQQQGLNIVASEDIKAKVSATLYDVPLDEALTHILTVAGYTWVHQGNVIIVTAVSTGSRVAPAAQGRRLRVFSLDYVAAADLDTAIKGLLSPVGQCFPTQSTNTDARKTQELLVVEDLPPYLERIEQYVAQVDRAPRQVLIEANILAVELRDDVEHGLNLGYLDQVGSPTFTLQTQGFANAKTLATGTAPAIFFNVAAADIHALVQALETVEDAKTLATPKVLALNGQQARIQIGQQLGYRVTTTTQTSTLEEVQFLDVGVVLRVTPWITQDNQVVMQVQPEVSSGQINPDTELPEEETTEVETSLMLPDGYGMVIGGLIQEEDVETQQKIPLLGDIWLVGRLFQNRKLTRKRTEIIITLVPHVVPYRPTRHQAECDQFRRATTPLVYGPLRENPRPGEPRVPDSARFGGAHAKLHRLNPVPDRRCWTPRPSQEICLPEMILPELQPFGPYPVEPDRSALEPYLPPGAEPHQAVPEIVPPAESRPILPQPWSLPVGPD